MASRLKICFTASEAAPFAKTGGLADVAAALPKQLRRSGHDVRVFLPLHGVIDGHAHGIEPVEDVQHVPLELGSRTVVFSLRSARFRDSELAVYFVDCPELFHRPSIYTDAPDEQRRFVLFSAAVISACQHLRWAPDLFHCNDWHTALIPLLLRTAFEWDAPFRTSKTLLTIHNIGYQGIGGADTLGELALDRWAHLFDREDLDAGRVNLLKTGLIYANAITTVSPTYAREIQTDDYGMGLQGVLRARRRRLVGILNGVDYAEWSPERDRLIPHRYSRDRMAGKSKNKQDLLRELGLPDDDGAPLLGVISRLTSQKGFDLCVPVLPELLATQNVRLAALGSGEAEYEELFTWLQDRFPLQVSFYRGYNNKLAHWIEAGSDMFLMPSRYEPCGLNQMFSMRYGTLPVVRRTGGLADSVRDWNGRDESGTGFVFDHFTPAGLREALDRALGAYATPPLWKQLVHNAMTEDFSWKHQARRYTELYRWLLEPSP
jgi:starch synthase